MSKIVVDQATAQALRGADSAQTLVDPSGRIIGHFVPALRPDPGLEPVLSEEELQRREKEEPRRSLREILADLEKRA